MNEEQKRIYEITYLTVLQTVAPRVATFGQAVQEASDAAKAAVDQYPKAASAKSTTTKDK